MQYAEHLKSTGEVRPMQVCKLAFPWYKSMFDYKNVYKQRSQYLIF